MTTATAVISIIAAFFAGGAIFACIEAASFPKGAGITTSIILAAISLTVLITRLCTV